MTIISDYSIIWQNFIVISDEMEEAKAVEILQEINANKQLELTESQQEFFDCIRQESLRNKIEQALQSHAASKRTKKIWQVAVSSMVLIGVTLSFICYDQQKKHDKAFTALNIAIMDKNIPAMQIIDKVLAFNQRWEKPMGLPLNSWFEQDRKELLKTTNGIIRKREHDAFNTLNHVIMDQEIPTLEIINKVLDFNQVWEKAMGLLRVSGFEQDRAKLKQAVNDVIRKRLQVLVKAAQTKDADPKLRNKIEQLIVSVKHWPDTALRQTVQNETQPVLKSYQLLTSLRKNLGEAPTLAWKAYYEQKTLVANTAVHWNEMDTLLSKIHAAIVNRIKTNAKDALISGERDDLEKSIEELTLLVTDDSDAEAENLLTTKMKPALEVVVRQEKLEALLSAVEGENEPLSMKKQVKNNWDPKFTTEQRGEISSLLQKNYESFENQKMPTIHDLNSRDQIKDIRDKLRKLDTSTTGILSIGKDTAVYEFRYRRPDIIQAKINQWQKKIEQYELALDKGITGYLTFIGNGKDNKNTDPLGFTRCSDDDVEITIDDNMKLPDEPNKRSECSNLSIKWKIKFNLREGRHAIEAVKHNKWIPHNKLLANFDKHWKGGEFRLTDKNICEFINKEEITLPAKLYKLKFSQH